MIMQIWVDLHNTFLVVRVTYNNEILFALNNTQESLEVEGYRRRGTVYVRNIKLEDVNLKNRCWSWLHKANVYGMKLLK